MEFRPAVWRCRIIVNTCPTLPAPPVGNHPGLARAGTSRKRDLMTGPRPFFEDVCASFGLGAIRDTPRPVPGGLSNRLYHVVTDRGEYAIKRMVANADSPGFQANVESSFAVERRALAAGIAMPVPIPVSGTDTALARVMDGDQASWVRAHEWVFAERVSAAALEPGDVEQIGTIIATLHRLPMEVAANVAAAGSPPVARVWSAALATHNEDASLVEAIEFLEAVVRRGAMAPRSRPVLSHRDLDAKNVLRDARGALVVIDWDAAGPVEPQGDVVAVAMDWSGLREGHLSAPAFEIMLNAYVQAGGHLTPLTGASFAGWAEGVLDWLWFNLERVRSPEAGERALGQAEIAATAEFLPAAAEWIAIFT